MEIRLRAAHTAFGGLVIRVFKNTDLNHKAKLRREWKKKRLLRQIYMNFPTEKETAIVPSVEANGGCNN